MRDVPVSLDQALASLSIQSTKHHLLNNNNNTQNNIDVSTLEQNGPKSPITCTTIIDSANTTLEDTLNEYIRHEINLQMTCVQLSSLFGQDSVSLNGLKGLFRRLADEHEVNVSGVSLYIRKRLLHVRLSEGKCSSDVTQFISSQEELNVNNQKVFELISNGYMEHLIKLHREQITYIHRIKVLDPLTRHTLSRQFIRNRQYLIYHLSFLLNQLKMCSNLDLNVNNSNSDNELGLVMWDRNLPSSLSFFSDTFRY